jgi:proteasome assembly chaperone (PAC2) family protein
MGMVAQVAAQYLARRLGAARLAELAGGEHFHPEGVSVQSGLVLPVAPPATILWRCQAQERDLVVLLGDQQPSVDSWGFCRSAMARAQELGVVRAFTFAAMATPSPADAPARVFVAATEPGLLAELSRLDVEPIRSGEIGGMNGIFLAAAAEQRIPAACLLGEIPYFAAAVSNPRAAAAVLRVFARFARLQLDLSELEREGTEVQRQISAHYEQIQKTLRAIHEAAGQEAQRSQREAGSEADWPKPFAEGPTPAERARIEALFDAARRDRSKALELKAELDRLGVYREHENRFLDLFRRAE